MPAWEKDPGYWMWYWKLVFQSYGAKSVDSFDIQEEMVQHAKQATSQFDTINIISIGSEK